MKNRYEDCVKHNRQEFYMPKDLYDEKTDLFYCPHCKQVLLFGLKKIEHFNDYSLISTNCRNCRNYINFKIIKIEKKLIYLDQSILSNLYKIEDEKYNKNIDIHTYNELLKKLKEAKKLQKIGIIISDIHAFETTGIPDSYTDQRDKLWEFSNNLSSGNIGGDFDDALSEDFVRILKINRGLKFFKTNPRQVDFTFVQLTNKWRLQLFKINPDERKNIQNDYRNILEWQKNKKIFNNYQDCIDFILDFNLSEFISAINNFINEIENNIDLDLLTNRHYNSYYYYFYYLLSSNDKKLHAQFLLDEFIKNKFENLPRLKLQNIFHGELLWDWCQNNRKNEKKFNENYGISRLKDIEHLITYLPYVDLITVDTEMFNFCKRESIQKELSKYQCQIIPGNKLSELNFWLDSVLLEKESDELKLTRRLFFGKNAHEIKLQDEKLVAEIINELRQPKQESDK